jgi:hypothetical protein
VGGVLAAFGQLAYFIGHHGKAAAHFAGSCGFNGGIQCQQIGLVGNGGNGGQRGFDAGPFLCKGCWLRSC